MKPGWLAAAVLVAPAIVLRGDGSAASAGRVGPAAAPALSRPQEHVEVPPAAVLGRRLPMLVLSRRI